MLTTNLLYIYLPPWRYDWVMTWMPWLNQEQTSSIILEIYQRILMFLFSAWIKIWLFFMTIFLSPTWIGEWTPFVRALNRCKLYHVVLALIDLSVQLHKMNLPFARELWSNSSKTIFTRPREKGTPHKVVSGGRWRRRSLWWSSTNM